MTEREVNEVLRARGIREYMPTAGLAEMLGISGAAVKNALACGDLYRIKRGTVARSDLAVWMASRPDVLAQMLSAGKRPAAAADGGLFVPGWRNDVNFTVSAAKV